ncbi:MAG: NUDIX hydrolase [bacterium]|nr:NUDIX hydrolase [bacterium]
MSDNYATYQVSLKVLFKRGKSVLLICDQNGVWDFPGGRIDLTETRSSFSAVIDREIKEELGEDITYTLGAPVLCFSRHLVDQAEPVLIVVYSAEYLGGSIQLSLEHDSWEWIDPSLYSFREEDFFSKEEYDAIVPYLQSS